MACTGRRCRHSRRCCQTNEIEQVIDYVMFLAMRGESELGLIDVASGATENDPNALPDDVVNEVIGQVFNKWKLAQNQMVNPPIARTPSSHDSIVRGRDLFLKSDCKDCHGVLAMGDGTSFVSQEDFNEVVFGGNPSELKDACRTPCPTRSGRCGTRSRTNGATRCDRPT